MKSTIGKTNRDKRTSQPERIHDGVSRRELIRDLTLGSLAVAGLTFPSPIEAKSKLAYSVEPRAVQAPSLPSGVYRSSSNGFVGELIIGSVDSAGNLIDSQWKYGLQVDRIQGFWDEPSRTIRFQRIINPADPSTIQVYTGYLFFDNLAFVGVPTGGVGAYTLVGSFEAFSGTGGSARRSVYGWHAQIGFAPA